MGYSVLGSITPDNLIGGQEVNLLTTKVIVLTGQNLKRGTVLGEINKALGSTSGTAGTNTGNGTCTGVALKSNTKVGTYTLKCISTATNGGTFSVIDPNGIRLADAVVGSAYSNTQIGFTINDGSTDFAAGDSFTITVSAGSGKVKTVLNTAVDGSQVAKYVLADDVDASSADKGAMAYKTGIFNRGALIVGTDDTIGNHEAELADAGIFLKAEL